MPTEQELQAALAAPEKLLLPEQVLLPEGTRRGQAVLVRDGRFAAVGPADGIVAANPHLAPVTLPDTLLMPGFFDAHHHLTQAFGKGLAFGEPSEIFRRIWVPLEASLDADLVRLAAKLAAFESLRGGFTTAVDAGTRAEEYTGAIAEAARDTGLRCVLAQICNDGDGADPGPILRRADAHLARWQGDSLVHPSLAISIPEAATDAMLGAVYARCAEAGVVFQTHANEHLVAVERSLIARGLRPVEHLAAAGALGPNALLAHATLLTPRELAMLRETGTAVAYNPVATQWKGNAAAPAELMAAMGIRFGIGTDATRADAFRLLDAAEAVQRTAFGLANGDFSAGGGWLWVDHATRSGAEACGLGGVTGAIAPGLAADFLLLDLAVPSMLPSWDLSWELVRFAARDQITAVFTNGALRLWQGWPVDWDARALMREVTARVEAAVARAPIQRIHPTADLHRARHAAADAARAQGAAWSRS
ncbi:amidohydrolase family protein [Roseomonas sp. NAR14]|uniref:Amidohydrolase family protein n=1 Tax=Roseomonas acroporae TaxID=2937791 RepID=A0A9X1YBM1_9PROT|nr:amidohydrolase family protein [Roseomonas acroporae]MCK8787131.1 amidohydrolase family protein [Roseomonas acroporae]